MSYLLDGVEVTFEFWPHSPPYMEIEDASKREVMGAVQRLGFEASETTAINTVDVYAKHGLDIHDFKELRLHGNQ